MAKKDLWNGLDVDVSVGAQFVNSNTTLTGDEVDLLGYEGCLAVIASGAMAGSAAANIYTPELQHSDSSGTGYTAVADADLYPDTTPEASAVHHGTTDKTTKKIGYRGTKRYVRLVITTTAFSTAGGNVCGLIVKGAPHIQSVGA